MPANISRLQIWEFREIQMTMATHKSKSRQTTTQRTPHPGFASFSRASLQYAAGALRPRQWYKVRTRAELPGEVSDG
jgi:hypothetical protein